VTYYRCRAREMGYTCRQKSVNAHVIDEQVARVLQQLKPPHNWHQGVTETVGELLGEQKLEARLAEIYDIIRRVDTRWDFGFFASEEEYFEQRLKLQHEVERLTPVSDDELAEAADLLENFAKHWDQCLGDTDAQHELVKLIMERVYVCNEEVVAMTLKSNCHVILGHKMSGPTESSIDPLSASTSFLGGDDGI
jgi:hypothetical protein